MTRQRGVCVVLCVLFCAVMIAGCDKKGDKDEAAKENADLKSQLAEKVKAFDTANAACKELETSLSEQKKTYEDEIGKLAGEKEQAVARMKEAVTNAGQSKKQLIDLKILVTGLQDQLKQKTAVVLKKDNEIKLLKEAIDELRKSAIPEVIPAE